MLALTRNPKEGNNTLDVYIDKELIVSLQVIEVFKDKRVKFSLSMRKGVNLKEQGFFSRLFGFIYKRNSILKRSKSDEIEILLNKKHCVTFFINEVKKTGDVKLAISPEPYVTILRRELLDRTDPGMNSKT